MPNNLVEIDRWRPIRRGGSFTATIVCPDCGRDIGLHTLDIDSKGIVYPSVLCPWNRKRHPELNEQMNRDEADDCEFHQQIRLVNWPPAALTQEG